jgi:hypothetical protein
MLSELLHTVQENPDAAAALAAILSSLVALLAVVATIIATIVNFFSSRRHILATVVSAKRQDWINSLRDELAKAVLVLTEISTLYDKRLDKQQFIAEIPDPDDPARKALRELQRDFSLSRSRITLLLNPNDDNHTALRRELSLAFDMVHCPPEIVEGIDNQIETVIRISQLVLQREWEKVKRLR